MSTGQDLPLDSTLYSLDDEELKFFKSQIGITNDEELKNHILTVQEKAYKVYPYPCIRRFAFAKLKISRLPAYRHFLQLGKTRSPAIFLDIGCCFGNDARKAVVDGYPIRSVIASDLRPEYWKLGHELFKSTPQSFPVPFVPGDVFDPAFLAPAQPAYSLPSTPTPNLRSVTTLTPLIGHVSAIHASSFFHLFNEAQQFELAQKMASLLSPQAGSVIFGVHRGQLQKGTRVNSRGQNAFAHSPTTWEELWNGQVFKKGTVQVKTELTKVTMRELPSGADRYILAWSVVRL